MTLHELVQQRKSITEDILQHMHAEIRNIKISAEDMIECATNIKGQGYSLFIRAREEFLDKIDSLEQQLEMSSDINRFTRQ